MKRSWIVFASVLILGGCNEIDTPNGKVPAEYLDEAQAVAGTYVGHFNGQATTLVLSLNGDQPQVRVISPRNNDLLDEACSSQIGQMKRFKAEQVGNNQYRLERVTFDFSPNRCLLEGKELYLSFDSSSRRISASIVRDSEQHYECGFPAPTAAPERDPHFPEPDPTPDLPDCKWKTYYTYIEGSFVRQ